MGSHTRNWIGTELSSGRYCVSEKLGEGGMGYVYRARDRNLDADVVIKVPRQAMLLEDPSFADRFRREIRSLVNLTHPHIVKISDVGEHEGLPFAVMQHLGGGDLENRLPVDDVIDPSSLADWLLDIAKALDFVHRKGYIHRDVKPGNILFDGEGMAYLSDFGVVKVVSDSARQTQSRGLTGTGIALGTVDYMAPEVLLDQPFDGRADQYSLATTVYEILAGRRAFEASAPSAVIAEKVTKDPPRLSTLRPELPAALCDALVRGMAKSPDDRYANCREFAEAVLAAASSPSPHLPPSLPAQNVAGDNRITQLCPSCGKRLQLAATVAGKTLPCPACQTTLTVAPDLSTLHVAAVSAPMIVPPPPPPKTPSPPFVKPPSQTVTSSTGSAETPHAGTGTDFRPSELTSSNLVQRVRHWAVWGTTLALVALAVSLAIVVWVGAPEPSGQSGPVASSSDDQSKPVESGSPRSVAPHREKSASSEVQGNANIAVLADKAGLDESNSSALRSTTSERSRGDMPATSLPEDSAAMAPTGAVNEDIHDESAEPLRAIPEEITNSIGMKLKLIPAGEFMMGSGESAKSLAEAFDTKVEYFEDEYPQHRVRITKPFYLGVHEVTQGEWERVMGTRPWSDDDDVKQGAEYAVTYVSWDDALEFCKKLSTKEGRTYRLPTEAQWEYACRAGTLTMYSFGDDASDLDAYAWHYENTHDAGEEYAHRVGQKRPNAWGLYDMHGNVAEWCSDWQDSDYYGSSPSADPTGPSTGSFRMFRGGGWRAGPWSCRSAARSEYSPEDRDIDIGFRVAQVPAESSTPPKSQPPHQTDPEPSRDDMSVTSLPEEPVVTPPARAAAEDTHERPVKTPSPLAVAPLDVAEARRHQQAWSDHLAVPVEKTNSIGMNLKLIPAGEFMMGSGKSREWLAKEFNTKAVFFENQFPQHRVRITKAFYLSTTEVTQGEWERVMGTRPWSDDDDVKQGAEYAATHVSWDDALEFCGRLSAQEGEMYRLPTEAEWEYGCRAGSTTVYSFGDDQSKLGTYAWIADDIHERCTNRVGQKRPNTWGLHDMHGNVREWCLDWYDADYYGEKSATDDPTGPATGSYRVVRNASWDPFSGYYQSAFRNSYSPVARYVDLGFRVVQVLAESSTSSKSQPPHQTDPEPSRDDMSVTSLPEEPVVTPPALAAAEDTHEQPMKTSPLLAVAPFDAAEARRHQQAWSGHLAVPEEITNSIGMKLKLIPAGEFSMGSSESAESLAKNFDAKAEYFEDEYPQHRVRITKPFYLGVHEVTQAQWEAVMDSRPWSGEKYVKAGSDLPATYVSWDDALEFCKMLSTKEGRTYRLPTEAQWEYACRAGTTTMYNYGNDVSDLDSHAWFNENAWDVDEKYAHQVGQKRPNSWGLYDMHGNVWEWCQDWYADDYYENSPADDPTGPANGSYRVARGGSWDFNPGGCRSAFRGRYAPGHRDNNLGFRVAQVLAE